MFSINAELPAKTLPEFVALAKAQPGKLNYGSSGASTQAHLLIEMWSERAGIKMQHIPYKGGAPAALAVATNEVQFVMLSPLGILNFVEAGKVRSLATGSLQRDPTLPHLPTASERLSRFRGGAMARPSHHARHTEGRRGEDQHGGEQRAQGP